MKFFGYVNNSQFKKRKKKRKKKNSFSWYYCSEYNHGIIKRTCHYLMMVIIINQENLRQTPQKTAFNLFFYYVKKALYTLIEPTFFYLQTPRHNYPFRRILQFHQTRALHT